MENTHCLFQALLRPGEREYYSNPLYEHNELAIWPSVHPQSLQLWRGQSLHHYIQKTKLIGAALIIFGDDGTSLDSHPCLAPKAFS